MSVNQNVNNSISGTQYGSSAKVSPKSHELSPSKPSKNLTMAVKKRRSRTKKLYK